jgi:hypothetical protein
MFCSSSCNKSFSSHSKMFCAFLLFSLAPALWKVLLVADPSIVGKASGDAAFTSASARRLR